MLDTAKKYLWVTLFCVVFGAIYEYFSFGVYSNYMIYAFMIPFVLGVIPFFLIGRGGYEAEKRPRAIGIWNAGVATLTVGSFFMGILEIYGTTNGLAVVYLIVGIILLVIGMLTGISILLGGDDINKQG